jgi:hypothetical protein
VTKAPIEATERWRIGVRRFQDKHPYASLLIGFHAYWLYAPRTDEPDDPTFRHPVFGESLGPTLTGGDLRRVKEFLVELKAFQEQLGLKTAETGHQADWLEPDHYLPHGRLLQLMDALSLVLSSQLVPSRSGQTRGFGEDPFELRNVPRTSWEDRVSLSFTPDGAGRIIVDPYPFDRDKLRVIIPRKRIAVGADGPLTSPSAWYAAPLEFTAVQFVAA